MRRIHLWHAVGILGVAGLVYFYHGAFRGLLPIPSDALVGLYHPFRDLYAPQFPNGIPFRNFLLTDPIRQIIPWKELAVSLMSGGKLPLWNPYEMAGKPLLGNFQSSPWYPLNILFLFKPLSYTWSIFIVLQQALAAFFMFLYLRTQKISRETSAFGAFIFAFSGFLIAWLEWGTIGHTLLWLPLVLLAIDKITQKQNVSKTFYLVYILALASSFFAGHLQTFIYICAISFAYFLLRLQDVEKGKKLKKIALFIILNAFLAALTIAQWLPTLTFLLHSARDLDQNMSTLGWFIPPQHLLQLFAPDFFGNPATLNYWGVWNYAEFFGYIGVVPLVLAFLTIGKKSKEIIFFQIVILVSLALSVANPLTEFIYGLNIPFFSSTQPTRLMSLVSFSLVVLACFGISEVLEKKIWRKVLFLSGAALFFSLAIWGVTVLNIFEIGSENLSVTKRNIILPSILLGSGVIGLILLQKFQKKEYMRASIFLLLVGITIFDLTRTAQKFTPFSPRDYFYPTTKTIEFLKGDQDTFRIASTDDRILAPNIATFYRIQSIEGYDPLYLKNYAKFIALNERQETDINPPYGYNRIITPHNLNTQLIDFLNVKYILSLSDIEDETLVKVAEEGETKIYENREVFPRAFFVEEVRSQDTDDEVAQKMKESDLSRIAFTTDDIKDSIFATGSARIEKYSENEIIIHTTAEEEGFLVISDVFYPTWHVKINDKGSTIYKVNLAFRGIVVPAGENEIVLHASLF